MAHRISRIWIRRTMSAGVAAVTVMAAVGAATRPADAQGRGFRVTISESRKDAIRRIDGEGILELGGSTKINGTFPIQGGPADFDGKSEFILSVTPNVVGAAGVGGGSHPFLDFAAALGDASTYRAGGTKATYQFTAEDENGNPRKVGSLTLNIKNNTCTFQGTFTFSDLRFGTDPALTGDLTGANGPVGGDVEIFTELIGANGGGNGTFAGTASGRARTTTRNVGGEPVELTSATVSATANPAP